MTLTESDLSHLLDLVSKTRQHELNCDEFLMFAAALAEGTVANEEQLGSLRQHLEICGDCSEEYQALLRALDSDENAQ